MSINTMSSEVKCVCILSFAHNQEMGTSAAAEANSTASADFFPPPT